MKQKQTYRDYLQGSLLAKITLAGWLLVCAAGIYCTIKLTGFTNHGMTAAIYGGLALVLALTWLFHRKLPKAALALEILLLAGLVLAMQPVGKVSEVAQEASQTKEYETVQIAVLKDSKLTAEQDLSKQVLGYVNGDERAYERSSEILTEHGKTVAKSKPLRSAKTLYRQLQKGSVQMIVLTAETRSDLTDLDEDYEQKIRVLFEKDYEVGTAEAKLVDIRSESFTVYLCGTDLSSGSNINSTGRGDVNILLTINPKTKQVYLQTIPRDTFVFIPCRGGSSKLSYSGWWGGVQSSIESIEDKFDIEINYYAKINFEGLKDLVDALGGVEVYSHYTYTVGEYHFVKGMNQVNGDQALMFARLRKMLPQNELSRGQHQMELIKAIFRKFAQDPTYDHCMALLDAVKGNFVTNFPQKDYADAFSLVVDLLPELENMENHSIKGVYQWHDDEIRDHRYQYYYYPEESEIQRVHDTILAVKNGEDYT